MADFGLNARALQIADRMVVMRQGRIVGDRRRDDVTADDVVALMTGEGRPVSAVQPQRSIGGGERFHA